MTIQQEIKSIAIVIDTLNGGGAEKVCLTLAEAYRKLGHRAHLIVLKKKCDYIPNAYLEVTFLSQDKKLKLYSKKNQVLLAEKLNKFAKANGPFDVCLSNLDECHVVVRLANLPRTLYVVHNSIEQNLLRVKKLGPFKYWRKLSQLKALNQQNIVTVSKGVCEEIRTSGRVEAHSTKTILNPINVELIQHLAEQKTDGLPEQPYLLHIGRFAKQKRHDILFAALKKMLHKSQHQQGVPIKTLVLLSKPSAKLSKTIAKFDLEKHVVVLPFQQNPYTFIKHAAALVLSSDYEGFGLVLAEALACETPVVSTECPHGPSEILVGKLSRYLTKVGDADALAEAMLKAVENRGDFQCAPIVNKLRDTSIAEQYLAHAEDMFGVL